MFKPAEGYIHIEPIEKDSVFASDNPKLSHSGKILTGEDKGKIVFYREHGVYFIEHKGEDIYVVRNHPEFILGYDES